MTIDERLDKIAERHEALVLNLPLESVKLVRQRNNIEHLCKEIDALGESTRDLLRVALIHQIRITGPEKS